MGGARMHIYGVDVFMRRRERGRLELSAAVERETLPLHHLIQFKAEEALLLLSLSLVS